MPAGNPEAYSDPSSPHYRGKKKSKKFPVKTDKEKRLQDAAKMAMKNHK